MVLLRPLGCVAVDDDEGVIIEALLTGGAAHLSGKIAVGDCIEEVDGVRCQDVRHAADLISGANGTLLTVSVRQGGFEGGNSERVPMLRQPAARDAIDEVAQASNTFPQTFCCFLALQFP